MAKVEVGISWRPLSVLARAKVNDQYLQVVIYDFDEFMECVRNASGD